MKTNLKKSVKIVVATMIFGVMVFASSVTFATPSDPPSGGTEAPLPRPTLPGR